MTVSTPLIPRAFIWRRIHSLMGLWLVLFLMEHLLVNSQAALWIGDRGQGFINAVNSIHNFPYLEAIEIILLGVPIVLHGVWGIIYLRTSKANSYKTGHSQPHLPYGRNKAYTWQRITSWILLFGLIGHVASFRFFNYPLSSDLKEGKGYLVRLDMDSGLYTLSKKLDFKIYDRMAIDREKAQLSSSQNTQELKKASMAMQKEGGEVYNSQTDFLLETAQNFEKKENFVRALQTKTLSPHQVIALCPNFGLAELLVVRDTFKSPLYLVLYTLFVLSAVFHAFNGFWTFLITWGLILRYAAQKKMVKVAFALMILLGFLGLASIWGTYFVTLKS